MARSVREVLLPALCQARRAGHRVGRLVEHCRGRQALRVAVMAALAGGTLAAHAGVFDDDEARQRIEQLRNQLQLIQKSVDGRFGSLEAQVQDRSALIELGSTIDKLRDELARMRGQFEVMANRIEQAERRQKDFYADLDNRLRRMERAQEERAKEDLARNDKLKEDKEARERAEQESAAAEGKAYEAALAAYKAADYKAAAQQFEAFVAAWPESPLAGNAQYWNGNALFSLKDYKGAKAAQQKMVASSPDNPRVPDALLSIASAQAELGDTKAEQATLKDLVARFPKSPAADQAKQRLARRPAR